MTNISDNLRGAAFMAASMIAFVLNDAIVKLMADSLSIYQVMLLRGLMMTAMLGLVAWYSKAIFPTLTKSDWHTMSLRLVGEVGGTLCYLTALFNMPIANATAILQVLPLAITLAAAVFLREPVGWRRYLAILIGFMGVMIIVRPGSEGFNAFSMWALAAVGFIVLRDLSTRRLSGHVPSIFVALISAAVITIAGGLLSTTTAWKPVGSNELQWLFIASLFLVFGYLFAIMTMRVGEISFVSPFRYSILIWAIILGIVVFDDIPDGWTIAGSAIVVLTGIYTFYRERKIQKAIRLSYDLKPTDIKPTVNPDP